MTVGVELGLGLVLREAKEVGHRVGLGARPQHACNDERHNHDAGDGANDGKHAVALLLLLALLLFLRRLLGGGLRAHSAGTLRARQALRGAVPTRQWGGGGGGQHGCGVVNCLHAAGKVVMQRVIELVGRLEAVLGVLLHALEDDCLKLRVHVGVNLAGWHGLLGDLLHGHGHGVVAVKRHAASGGLVHHDA